MIQREPFHRVKDSVVPCLGLGLVSLGQGSCRSLVSNVSLLGMSCGISLKGSETDKDPRLSGFLHSECGGRSSLFFWVSLIEVTHVPYTPGFCFVLFVLRWYGQRESSLSRYQDTSDDGINRTEMKGCDCGNIWLLIIPSCKTLRKEALAHKEPLFFQLWICTSCYI